VDRTHYTRAVQPEIDINRVLQERYETSEPLTFTRTMLWDVEQRKAAAPGTYIPFVVRESSGVPSSACGCNPTTTGWFSSGRISITTSRR